MKAVKLVLFMCVVLFVLWAALGCVLVAPACSPPSRPAIPRSTCASSSRPSG